MSNLNEEKNKKMTEGEMKELMIFILANLSWIG